MKRILLFLRKLIVSTKGAATSPRDTHFFYLLSAFYGKKRNPVSGRLCQNQFFLMISLLFIFSLSIGSVRCEEWTQINASAFDSKLEVSGYFQEGLFLNGYLYMITSDKKDLEDPNRKGCLWASKVWDDPNYWAASRLSQWRQAGVFRDARLDKIFSGAGDPVVALFDDGECRLSFLKDPNNIKKQIGFSDLYKFKFEKWRITNGIVFSNRIYVCISEQDYGCRLLFGDINSSIISESFSNDAIPLNNPNITSIPLLAEFGGHLFLGTRNSTSGALFYYMSENDNWSPFDSSGFDDTNIFDQIISFSSIIEFRGYLWLLTESMDGGKRVWTLWESGVSVDSSNNDYTWKRRFSSKENALPFSDMNTVSVTGLLKANDYLYLGVITDGGGGVWKGYLGVDWSFLPSAIFNSSNKLKGCLLNSADTQNKYIFAVTDNYDEGIKIYARWIPQILLSGFTTEDRFLGPEKTIIKIVHGCNWKGDGISEDPNIIAQSYLISQRGISEMIFDQNSNAWQPDNDPNVVLKDGVYAFKWEAYYGDARERVLSHLTFAWDSNAPSTPNGISAVGGDRNIKLNWNHSKDVFDTGITSVTDQTIKKYLSDALIFGDTLKDYEIEYWEYADSNLFANGQIEKNSFLVSVEKSGYRITGLNNLTPYKIHLRARDKSGNTSPWSDPIEATPKPTLGWTDLVDERGGCFINTVSEEREESPSMGNDNKRRFIAGVKGGISRFRAKEAEQVYDKDDKWSIGIEMGWVYRSNVEVALSAGYLNMDGMQLLFDTFEKSQDTVSFTVVPSSITLRWFFNDKDKEGLLNPYIGAGCDIWYYKEDKFNQKDIDGFRYGVHGTAGIRFLLDHFSPDDAKLLFEDYGIINTYFTIEAIFNSIDNLGDSKLDMSGTAFHAGFLFLF